VFIEPAEHIAPPVFSTRDSEPRNGSIQTKLTANAEAH
jgi:hypothetical protein